jgi:MFS family permease
MAADQLGTSNTLIAAAVFASLMAPSAIGAPLAGRTAPATAQCAGMVIFLGAVIVVLASLRLGLVASLLAASGLAGAAQGATFAGSMRALLAGAGPADRAGVLSAIYLISYSGAAIPALIAGNCRARWASSRSRAATGRWRRPRASSRSPQRAIHTRRRRLQAEAAGEHPCAPTPAIAHRHEPKGELTCRSAET